MVIVPFITMEGDMPNRERMRITTEELRLWAARERIAAKAAWLLADRRMHEKKRARVDVPLKVKAPMVYPLGSLSRTERRKAKIERSEDFHLTHNPFRSLKG